MSRSERVQEALGIPGWMDEAELVWLEGQALVAERIVEVGSWQGRSTKALAATPGVVYAVDDWRGEADDPVPELGALFAENLKDELAAGKVIVVEKPSLEAAQELDDLDLVFIDGSHNYPDPLLDIQSWRPRLKPGGVLCGHDCSIPGVLHSLGEELNSEVDNPAGSIWVAR